MVQAVKNEIRSSENVKSLDENKENHLLFHNLWDRRRAGSDQTLRNFPFHPSALTKAAHFRSLNRRRCCCRCGGISECSQQLLVVAVKLNHHEASLGNLV